MGKSKPTNEQGRYARARVARLQPVKQAIQQLELPLIRLRKLNGILNALAMQIEDGGDSLEVNHFLLEALRTGVRHQVGSERGAAALAAIDSLAEEMRTY